MIEIEKGIPFPIRRRSPGTGRPPAIGRDAVEAMEKMEIGDSIKVNVTIHKNTLYVFLAREGKKAGKKFRFTSEAGGVRIWRAE
jgi:hypothetical protein